MKGLHRTLASLKANRRVWRNVSGIARPVGIASFEEFQELRSFGSNPGALRGFVYAPQTLRIHPALMVVLHGCSQTAGQYAMSAGWKTVAERYGFILLLPQQERSNNQNACFNWFQPGDTQRDRGEVLSIRQMIDKTAADQSVDLARVYVTAGGAMASALLACYPEIFAGGAIIAGLPYGAATNIQQEFESMFQSRQRSAAEWASLVTAAAPRPPKWPRISVWHGSTDMTVVPANQLEILKQWRALHGLLHASPTRSVVHGALRDVWRDESGAEMIEAYKIPGMGHGTPIAAGTADDRCGTAAAFILDVGLASSFHIARFFGVSEPDLGAAMEASDAVNGASAHSHEFQSAALPITVRCPAERRPTRIRSRRPSS